MVRILYYLFQLLHSLCCSTLINDTKFIIDDKDPAPYFFSSSIQKYLRFLTRPDYQKVFRKRLTPDQKSLSLPEYKFLTDEELNEEIRNIKEKADRLLQMPPVVKVYYSVAMINKM